jgi:hypothetical protein
MSAEPDETALYPQQALTAAKKLTVAGDALSKAFADLQVKLQAMNSKKPPSWGDDETGREFNKNYTLGEAPALKIWEFAGDVVRQFERLGPNVTDCVQGTVDVDDLIASWFPKH